MPHRRAGPRGGDSAIVCKSLASGGPARALGITVWRHSPRTHQTPHRTRPRENEIETRALQSPESSARGGRGAKPAIPSSWEQGYGRATAHALSTSVLPIAVVHRRNLTRPSEKAPSRTVLRLTGSSLRRARYTLTWCMACPLAHAVDETVGGDALLRLGHQVLLALARPVRRGVVVLATEQMALSVAAAYCDFNYQVMANKAGVLCVFTDKRLDVVK